MVWLLNWIWILQPQQDAHLKGQPALQGEINQNYIGSVVGFREMTSFGMNHEITIFGIIDDMY